MQPQETLQEAIMVAGQSTQHLGWTQHALPSAELTSDLTPSVANSCSSALTELTKARTRQNKANWMEPREEETGQVFGILGKDFYES
jgi:hypothetical protein